MTPEIHHSFWLDARNASTEKTYVYVWSPGIPAWQWLVWLSYATDTYQQCIVASEGELSHSSGAFLQGTHVVIVVMICISIGYPSIVRSPRNRYSLTTWKKKTCHILSYSLCTYLYNIYGMVRVQVPTYRTRYVCKYLVTNKNRVRALLYQVYCINI